MLFVLIWEEKEGKKETKEQTSKQIQWKFENEAVCRTRGKTGKQTKRKMRFVEFPGDSRKVMET